jgi:uncharacterized protein (TIGR04222 family)
LWAKLEALDLDGGAALSFSKRLARDNGWTADFARRVVLEYKRFVYLAATCGHPVTPSDEVDQAWHLHLVYTRSYWDELCGQVLGFPLHHGPTKGGAAEGHKFQDWYARTLQSYTVAFGTLPPADIWPEAAVRFGDAPHFRRVNLRRHWLLPRLRWPTAWRPGRREALALAALLVLAGCTARMPLNPLNWYGTEFLGLFWGLCAVLLPLSIWWRNRAVGPEEAYLGPPLSTYELARLADQGRRVAESALAVLVHAGHAELVPERKIKRTDAAPPTEPYEHAVWNLLAPSGAIGLDKLREQASGRNIGVLRALDKSLEDKGLKLSAGEQRRVDQIPLFTALGLGLFGLAKTVVGLNRDRPVGFLTISLLALGFLVFTYAKSYGSWATGRGRRLLREATTAVRQELQEGSTYSRSKVALSVALVGIAELQYLGLSTLATYLQPPSQAGGSDGGGGDSSGGDGGSGCGGGGCGGCGGCGS